MLQVVSSSGIYPGTADEVYTSQQSMNNILQGAVVLVQYDLAVHLVSFRHGFGMDPGRPQQPAA